MNEFDEMIRKLDAAIKRLGCAVDIENPAISFSGQPASKSGCEWCGYSVKNPCLRPYVSSAPSGVPF